MTKYIIVKVNNVGNYTKLLGYNDENRAVKTLKNKIKKDKVKYELWTSSKWNMYLETL